MTKRHDDHAPITAHRFLDQLWRYKRGSISRATSWGVTGLGTAMAVTAANVPGVSAAGRAHAAEDIGDRIAIAT